MSNVNSANVNDQVKVESIPKKQVVEPKQPEVAWIKRHYLSPDRHILPAHASLMQSVLAGKLSAPCGLCNKDISTTERDGFWWCDNCLRDLGNCTKCSKGFYRSRKSYFADHSSWIDVKPAARWERYGYCLFHGCIECGWKKTIVSCDKCGKFEESGKLEDGQFICRNCGLRSSSE